MVGTGPPDTGVGAPLYPFCSIGAAVAVGAVRTAAAQNPIASDLRRCERSAITDPLSSVSPPAYDPKVSLSWELTIMLSPIIKATGPDR